MNHTTGQVPAFSKICAVFGFLLIMLAVIAVPCGATNAANNSDNPVVTNQTTSPTTAATTEVTTSPTTEVTTSVTTTGPTEVTTSPTDQPTTVVTTSPATQATTTATPTDQPEIPAEVPLLSATKDVVTVQYSGVSGGNIWTHEEVGNIYPWVPGTESPGQVSGKITSRPFSLAVGSDNESRISYLDTSQHLVYAEKDKNGLWRTSTVDDTIPAGANSLALTPRNVPGISYYDTKNWCLNYAFYYAQQGSWHTESVECNWAGPYNSLAYNDDGLPLIGYYSDGINVNYQIQKFAQRDQNQWYRTTKEGGAAGMFTSLALNASGAPVIAHYIGSTGGLKYVYRKDKGRWPTDPWIANLQIDNGWVGKYLSLAVDDKNILHVSYYNETGKSLKYAEGPIGGTGNDFTRYTIDTGNVGMYTSLALDDQGNPHISYWDEQNKSLKYAKRYTNGTWTISEIRPWLAGSTLDKVSSLVFGPDNIPRLCYVEHRHDGTISLIHSRLVPGPSPGPTPNLVLFGDGRQFSNLPRGMDYQRVGECSAIRRNGTLEHFCGPLGQLNVEFKNHAWAQVTSGAGITTSGDLGTWDPRGGTSKTGKILDMQYASPDKKYLMVSQYFDDSFPKKDWRLVLYADRFGATHLEVQGDAADNPAVFKNVPTDTGWIRVAAGKDHALAIRSNGTIVAWGDNYAHQLDLPANAVYSDIAAGAYFSLGLTVEGNKNAGGYIRAVGGDKYGEVSGAPEDKAAYISIDAGPYTGAALTHDGHILIWGKNLSGIPTPTDGDYTDIALGLDTGIAIREYAPELHITGPLSPDTDVVSREGIKMHIPKGALFEHTVNGVMRVIAPNGTVLFWANDDEAAQVTFPEGTTFPSSAIHYLPKQSLILIPENYEATVYGTDTIISDFLRLAEQPPLMTTTAASWRDEQNASSQQLTPQGVCFADTGCSVGATSRGQLFLSKLQTPATGNIPVFSVQKFNDTMYVGKLSMLGSTDPANDRLIHLEKDNIDPDQPVKFNIMKSAAAMDSDSGVIVMAQVNLTNQSSVLHYMITGTASVSIPAMNITPKIWQKTEAGDVLVFASEPVKCSGVNACQATGNFTPSGAASYFANATMLYTLPPGAAVPVAAVSVMSDRLEATSTVNTGTNVEGTRDDHPSYDYYKDVVQYAQGKQKNDATHSSNAYLKPGKATITLTLPNSYIFFYNGHSQAGRFKYDDANLYSATGDPGAQIDDLTFTGVNFVFFMSCHSGSSSDTYGNLVDKCHDKGADCAFGFSDDIYRENPPIKYGQKFWDSVKSGNSWNQAHTDAVTAVKNDISTCTDSNNVCGYSTIYKQGSCDNKMLQKPEQESEKKPDTVYDDENGANITLQKSVIKSFTGISNQTIHYQGADHQIYADIYEFSSDTGKFYVNSVTGRVQNAQFISPAPLSTKEIDLDQAYFIAEAYAKQKYPTLWETSDQKGVNNTVKKLTNHGDESNYDFAWSDEYYTVDSNSNHYIVTGPNSVHVALTINGAIISYDERDFPLDPNLNLIPTLTEDQAWKYAQATYVANGIQNALKPEENNARGLHVVRNDSTNKQYLAWYFDAVNKTGSGGVVEINAHEGDVIRYFPYG